MTDRIAIKRLSASDCTLFEAVFRKIDAGNQKSINLNADILTGKLYPTLATSAAATENRITLAISLYGPNGKGPHRFTRKIIKDTTYKNWRLNGEFIPGPPDDKSRYDNIKPGDLAIMVFKGEVIPNGMDLIIVSQFSDKDVLLHAGLLQLFGNKSMIAVTSAQIADVVTSVELLENHPIHLAAANIEMEAALEDASQNGITGTGKLLTNKGNRKVSGSDLAKAKAKADLTGQDGEGLINGYLIGKVATGKISRYKWASSENAIEPFDFEIISLTGQRIFIDVKTTNGPLHNVIHLSLAEIIEASGDVPYKIYRVFNLNDDGGMLVISDDINQLASKIKTIHETHMPSGIRVDGFSVVTSSLQWGPEEYVERLDEDEGT